MQLAVPHLSAAGGLAGLLRGGMIDLAPAGDNGVTFGLSDAGLPKTQRHWAATCLAALLQTLRWLGFVGLSIVFSVART